MAQVARFKIHATKTDVKKQGLNNLKTATNLPRGSDSICANFSISL